MYRVIAESECRWGVGGHSQYIFKDDIMYTCVVRQYCVHVISSCYDIITCGYVVSYISVCICFCLSVELC